MAIIPARGGSKRLPRKNTLPIAGKPLISWTIEAAQKSKYIDEIFISTDDKDVIDIASKYNIDVPEIRPVELSSDDAKTQDVILYTLEKFGKDIDVIIILQPTSPLRCSEHIDSAFELFELKNASSVVSVTPCEHPPLWSNTLPSDGNLDGFLSPAANRRSQELEEYYRLNGAIYIYDTAEIKINGKMEISKNSYAFKMDNESSIDIDTKLDFEFSELLLNKALSE